MQVDAISSDDVQAGKTMRHALGLLAAVAVALAAGLATVDVPESDRSPRVLMRDAVEQGAHSSAPVPAPAQTGRGELDPELRRLDRANEHHG